MTGATLVRLAAAVLSTEKGRKTVGWVIAAILSPLILLAAFLCSFGTAAVEHNNFAVSASFYGPAFTDKIPTEYKDHITEMRTAFSLLDSAVTAVNAKAENGGLDPLQVKAVFYALCFGDDAPTRRAAANFVECFYRLEERTETTTDVLEDGTVVVQTTVYYVAIPLPLETVYEKLAAWQGEPVTEEDKANAAHIYSMVVGSTGGDIETNFDVDAAFGTFVCTDENDDWLNIYANYDIAQGRPCDTLELNLCKGDGTEENWSYHLNAAEQEVLARKMEEFCQQQNGMSLHDFARQLQEEPGPSPQIQMYSVTGWADCCSSWW